MTTESDTADSGSWGVGLIVGTAVTSIVAVCAIYISTTNAANLTDSQTTKLFPPPSASAPNVNVMTLGAPSAPAAPAPDSPAAATPKADTVP
jgi:hypothetical protein